MRVGWVDGECMLGLRAQEDTPRRISREGPAQRGRGHAEVVVSEAAAA